VEAGTAIRGNGGNTDIDADFHRRLPRENKTFIANVHLNSGGTLSSALKAFFGLSTMNWFFGRLISDITASSRFGLAGTVTTYHTRC